MKTWRPQPSIARFILLGGVFLCALAVVWLWGQLAERTAQVELDPTVFLLGLELFLVLTLAGILLYLAWCVFSMSYALHDEQLVVTCGGVRHIVPLGSITSIRAPGEDRGTVIWGSLPLFIPGYVVGAGTSEQLGDVLSIATTSFNRQTLVITPGLTIGVSPRDASGFVSALERARLRVSDLEESAGVSRVMYGPSAWGAPLWSNRAARWLLLGGLALNLLFFGYLSLVYSELPARLALHWNAQAEVDRIGTPIELLRLPLFALMIWLVNVILAWWASRREQAVSLFLLAGAVAVQIVFWAGALSIVLRAT